MFGQKMEAVTVCVGYADFLAETAKYNSGLFDRWLIVTTEDDRATREVCRRFSLPTLLTNDHQRGGDDFNKGAMIERGLQHLSAVGWRVHLDADVVLPLKFRSILESAHLDPRKIYGSDRVMVKSWSDWQKLLATGWVSTDYHCRVNPPAGFQIGHRWADAVGGWVPIGFTQIWHSDSDQYNGCRNRPYPQFHNDACRADVQHALQWDRRDRVLIPELLPVHLESEPAAMGANWRGRATKPFGPFGEQLFSKSKNYMG